MATISAVSAGGFSAEWLHAPDRWPGLREAWIEGLARWMPDNLYAHPDWCAAIEAAYPGTVGVVVLREGGAIRAVVPVLVKRAPFEIQAGRRNVCTLHPRTLRLTADELNLGPEPEAYETLFGALTRQRFDLFHLSLPADSPLWCFLARAGLRPYSPSPGGWNDRLTMPRDFDEYMAKFGAKSRKNRLREMKRLGARGVVRLERYGRPEQVDAFLGAAVPISRRTYQDKLLGAGLHHDEQLRPRIAMAARQGWLRSYVLRCGEAACAYMLGYQYQGRYFYCAVGYDPDWKDFGVGTVLQLLVLEEMFANDTPRVFDFGPSQPQKRYFGNERVATRTVLLFRPGIYPWFARNLHRTAGAAVRCAGVMLGASRLRTRVARAMRNARGA